MARPRPSLFEDLLKFYKVGKLISQGHSLNAVQTLTGHSISGIMLCVNRLKEHYRLQGDLLTSTGKCDVTSLTEPADALINYIERTIYGWSIGSGISVINLSFSYSLLTSQILSPAIFICKESYSSLRIKLTSVLTDVHQVISGIQTGKIDVGFFWQWSRKNERFPGIKVKEIEKNFDIVYISKNSDYINNINYDKDMDVLAGKAVLQAKGEFMDLVDPRYVIEPDAFAGGERVFVDSVDIVFSSILSGICDLGIIVANYQILEQLKFRGKLFFSKAIGTAKIICLSKKSTNEELQEKIGCFIDRLNDEIKKLPEYHESHWEVCDKNPRGDIFKRFKHGYYVDHDRKKSALKGRIHEWQPVWNSETFKLNADQANLAATNFAVFSGEIENQFGFKFTVNAKLDKNSFRIDAECINCFIEPGEDSDNHNKVKFTSDIYIFMKRGNDYVGYGLWNGEDNPDRRLPALYGIVISTVKLELPELKRISAIAMARIVGDAEYLGH